MRFLYILILALLSACTAIPISGVGLLSSRLGAGEYATYVQWNDDYAVTVSHYSEYLEEQYQSPRVDIKLFKHKSINGVRQWEHVKDGEIVRLAGFIEEGSEFNVMQAHVVKNNTLITDMPRYKLVTGKLVPGMSGGPVLNAQDQVVGINIGYSSKKLLIGKEKAFYSLFLPYSEIKKEWEYFLIKN